MIRRDIEPQLAPLSEPYILPYEQFKLKNGILVTFINDPSQEVFKIDISFEAGVYYQSQPLIASTTISMLNEGTEHHNSEEIADLYDFYGAYIDFNCGLNKSEISMISLCKYAKETISMMAELIKESIIPEKELDIFLTNKRQEFLVNKEKTSYMARKKFAEVFFGQSHPYANPLNDSDYLKINADLIREFYHNHINAQSCQITLCGNINKEILHIVTSEFEQLENRHNDNISPFIPFSPQASGRYHVTKSNAMQTSIRIGKEGVRLMEEEYAGYMLLNTVLGGYFGSRLISNIREEKGYTYSINSFNISMPQGSYWCIAADVNNDYKEETIEETIKEIERLKNERIGNEELELVKNFLHGDLLRELDGVFAQSDALKHKLNYNTDNTLYLNLIRKIKACTPEELQTLANKYWDIDQLYIVTAGK